MLGSLKLFGVPYLEEDASNQAQPLHLHLPCLLLIYLSLRDDWVSRSELAYLFHPDTPDTKAKKNLRQLLYRAKSLTWAFNLELEDELVRFSVASDVLTFKGAIRERNWQEAISLYEADLLSGYSHPGLETFNAWLELERSELAEQHKLALKQQAKIYQSSNMANTAAELLEDYLKLEPFDESVLSDYLRLLGELGLREKSLATYKAFCKHLKAEFDLEPLDETKVLAEALKSAKASSQTFETKRLRQNLPMQATRFVGRKQDLVRLSNKLSQKHCRVLSLIGLGGTGKTRLSLELARRVLPEFADGVFFVALNTATDKNSLFSMVAQVLGVQLSSSENAESELLEFLAKKNLLLILDNVEQLPETPEFIASALSKTAHLKILLTSRISMNLKTEWVYDVQGLPYPKVAKDDALGFDAVTLFIHGATKANPNFVLQDGDTSIIAEITQKVEGLPLALELASRWHRLLSFKQILDELKTGLELLSTEQTDIPKRQRSIAFVFEQTWQHLTKDQQAVLAALTVFQDGFNLEAAKAITGTHLPLLLSLLNQGLIRKQSNDRFNLHELLRQYAGEKLAAQGNLIEVKRAHLDYYLEFTKNGQQRMTIKGSEELMATFTLERENLFTALDYALSLYDASESQTLMAELWWFLYQKSFWLEAAHYLKAVYDKNGPENAEKVDVIIGLGVINIELANSKVGEQYTLEAVALGEKLGLDKYVQAGYGNLGVLFQRQSSYKQAHEYFVQAYQMSLKTQHVIDISLANLGSICIAQENYTQARRYLLEALTLIREQSTHDSLATCLGHLAELELCLGNLDKAESYAPEILSLEASINKQIYNYCKLSLIYAEKLDFKRAQEYADSALALTKHHCEMNTRIHALQVYGQAAYLNKNLGLAKQQALNALRLSEKHNHLGHLPYTQTLLASVEFALGHKRSALKYLKNALDNSKKQGPKKHFLTLVNLALDILLEECPQDAYRLMQVSKQTQNDMGIVVTPLGKQRFERVEKYASEQTKVKESELMSIDKSKTFLLNWVTDSLKHAKNSSEMLETH